VVFFKITNIAHDVATSIDVDESQNGAASDGYFAATMGELGCWIDSKVTQIMQTGLEHSRVPDVLRYLRIREAFLDPRVGIRKNLTYCGLPPLSDGGFSPLPKDISIATSHGTPFARLVDLVSAALLPTAVDYDLRLSVLLKGARGIGKHTTTRWVAQKSGIHLLEASMRRSIELINRA
jgi:peroxin-6